MIRILPLLLILLAVTGCCSTKNVSSSQEKADAVPFAYEPQSDALSFNEIWGYVMIGREKEFSPTMPVSDVGYFVSAIGLYSEVLPCPSRDKHFGAYKGRVHLVTSVDSKAQAHLLLDPSLPLRKKIVQGLLDAAETYDGLQVDWELIGERDADNFISFLQELKDGLGDKIFSVAVRARIKALQSDPFDYARIAGIADRVIVMAYDEHWGTSRPGAVASSEWCKKIADYTRTVVPAEKIVMGLPFYGRTWATYNDINKAFGMANIERIKHENGIHHVEREGGIPHFSYERKTGVTVWYNDAASVRALCQLYQSCGISSVAFWRVGQEDRSVWQELTLK